MTSSQENSGRQGNAKQQQMANYSTPLIYNMWYVVGYGEAFTEELNQVTLLNRSLVIYRTASGEPIVLQDRCPHRAYPLSKSRKGGDDIRCGYHGSKINSNGEIIEVPCQDVCPRIKIHKYPAREIGPLVWVWMGDPGSPDETTLPELPFDVENWEVSTGKFQVESNYLIMMENLMDLTHIPFLHRDTFNYPASYAKIPLQVEKNGLELEISRSDIGFFHRTAFFPDHISARLEDQEYDTTSISYFKSPGWMYAASDLLLKSDSDAELQKKYSFRIAHFLTPETQSTCHYWWFFARNYAMDDKEHTKNLTTALTTGFEQDMDCSRDIQSMHDKDGHPFHEIIFGADKSAILMRRIVMHILQNEVEAARES
jgi:vanillate O-demethylase monooxygenase subunit